MLILKLEIYDIFPDCQTIGEEESCSFDDGKSLGISTDLLLYPKSKSPNINTFTLSKVFLAQSPSIYIISNLIL